MNPISIRQLCFPVQINSTDDVVLRIDDITGQTAMQALPEGGFRQDFDGDRIRNSI
jgi:hypothetical protein